MAKYLDGNGVAFLWERMKKYVYDCCCSSGGGGTDNMKSVTYSQLVTLRSSNALEPGMQYRITDYVCTTTQEDTRAVSHPFDIIVVADDESTLNENARACLHEGDAYYSAEGSSAVLESWELKYCIDNDTDRFGWADDTNGKGVVYWLKDEKNNECPYDFKQIQFSKENDGDTEWLYTFTVYDADAEEAVYEDASISPQDTSGCMTFGNIIRPFTGDGYNYGVQGSLYLNMITFKNRYGSWCHSNTFGDGCYNNTFGNYCYSNTFGYLCQFNTFGSECNYNTFGNFFYHNTFGNNCASNTFGDGCSANTFGDHCNSNTFENDCNSNTFGDYCSSNTFGDHCHGNIFGEHCYSNTFRDSCYNNTFGDYCVDNTFGSDGSNNTFGIYCNLNTFGDGYNRNTFGNYCSHNTFGDNCQYIDFFVGANTQSNRYYHVMDGVSGTNSSHVTITGTGGNNYETYVGMDSSNTLKTWVLADLA